MGRRESGLAVALEFIDFIVPIRTIEGKYPGGWQRCLDEHKPLVGGRVWFDDHLFRDGAMNPLDIQRIVERWASKGFETMREVDGRSVWSDCCVVENMRGGPTLPCDWIDFTPDGKAAFLRGTEPGPIAGREPRQV